MVTVEMKSGEDLEFQLGTLVEMTAGGVLDVQRLLHDGRRETVGIVLAGAWVWAEVTE